VCRQSVDVKNGAVSAPSAVDAAVGLVGWLVLCFAAAAVGARYKPGAWYAGLRKPAWNPPKWLFAPVWTLLYAMMAVAAWLVWRDVGLSREVGLFVVQLVLNAAWTWLFFGLKRPGLAFADIVALWLAILATLVAFWSVRPLAALLLAPYLAWVTFAAALNAALWRLNRPLGGTSAG
jgi:tryptophan-rich sensory protein